jgi:hypothetical protein
VCAVNLRGKNYRYSHFSFIVLTLRYPAFTMDSNEEFSITLSDSESDSDSRADVRPPSDSETESEEIPKKGQRNSIGARLQALTQFELQVPHEKIIAQTGVSRSSLYKLRSKAISRG